MVTSRQIRAYARRYGRGCYVQASVHGCHEGTIEIFDPSGLLARTLRVRTAAWGAGPFDIRLSEIGAVINNIVGGRT